jgi:hypothetical protein
MKIRISAVFASIFAAAIFSLPAAAQSNDWNTVRQARPGTAVTVGRPNGQSLAGKLRGATADELVLKSDGTMDTVARSDVKSVHRSKRGHGIGRILIGAAAGAGIGLAAAVPITVLSKDPLAGAAGVLVGVPAGAVVAAVTGGKTKRGELLYFAP